MSDLEIREEVVDEPACRRDGCGPDNEHTHTMAFAMTTDDRKVAAIFCTGHDVMRDLAHRAVSDEWRKHEQENA